MKILALMLVAAFGCVAGAVPVSSPVGSDEQPRFRFKIPRADAPGFPPVRVDPAKVAIGERLFLETRFSQFFFAHSNGDVNSQPALGDPVVATTATKDSPLSGPFAGFAINCRTCHLVNEHFAAGRGNRAYADFAGRSPIPAREDGKTQTVRNSPSMVNATVLRESALLLHYDGEFASAADLVRGTLTGRNFGWLPGEQATAVHHIARVIREDNGRGPLAREFGGFAYREVFLGTNEALGEPDKRFRLPPEFCLDVTLASDEEVLGAAVKLLSAYMDSLQFSRDPGWEYDGSPYDAFLETNRIPRRIDSGASEQYYNRHLTDLFLSIRSPIFVFGTNGVAPPAPGRFKILPQPFAFGPLELAGARIFFATAKDNRGGSVGNCVACHRVPNFTDFGFHNTGVSQAEYDSLHGAGAFAKLKIPGLRQRSAHFDDWLPPTANHPRAHGPFDDIPSAGRPGHADLGLWNVYANPDVPGPQSALRGILDPGGKRVPDADLLPRTIGLFKTPSLRDLAMSNPYLHNGSQETIEEVLRFYIRMSALARAGKVRNAAPELLDVHLTDEDVAPLAAFLKSLDEDYE